MKVPEKTKLPQEVVEKDRWVIWTLEKKEVEEKLAKVPKTPWKYGGKYKYPGDPLDPENWTDFETARKYAKEGEGYGVEFVFVEGDDIAGVDYDDCITDGKVSKEVTELIQEAGTYAEVSPSGNGVHQIGFGKPSEQIRNSKKGVEAYDKERGFTFTGRKVEGGFGELKDFQPTLHKLQARYGETPKGRERKTSKEFTALDALEGYFPDHELKEYENYWQGPHPIHGSGTGRNFVIYKDGLAVCFRHGSKMDEWDLVGVLEGIIDCEDARSGPYCVKGEKWSKTIKAAFEHDLIDTFDAETLTRQANQMAQARKSKEVRETVDLEGLDQAEVGYSDLYLQQHELRGNFHVWVNDNHHFETDRKVSGRNIKQFIDDAIEVLDLDEIHGSQLRKAFNRLKNEAQEEAVEASSGSGEKFDWRPIARQILEEERIVTAEDSEQMWIYEDGVYEGRGEAAVKARAQSIIPDDITTGLRNQITEYVKWENPIRREELNNPDRLNDIEAEQLTNLRSGLLNPETGEVYDHTPEYLSTTQIPVKYDPTAKCPYFKELVEEIFGEDQIGIVKQMMGACLLKDYRYDTLFVFLGGGSNGKTTFIKILRKLLGKENVSSESMQDLQRRFSRAQLYGKLANLCGDLPTRKLKDTGVIKQLSGGEPVRAERKNQSPFNFENYATLIFAANKLPRSPEDTYAFHRRVAIIDFPYKFKKNPDPKKPNEKEKKDRGEILSKVEEELSGILNFALEGLEEVIESGEITEVETVEERARKYKKESDSIWAFANAKLEEARDEWVKRSEVYREYSKFCRENDFKPIRQSQFTQILPEKIMTSKGQVRAENGRPRVWHDIKLVEAEESHASHPSRRGTLQDFRNDSDKQGVSELEVEKEGDNARKNGNKPLRDTGDARDKTGKVEDLGTLDRNQKDKTRALWKIVETLENEFSEEVLFKEAEAEGVSEESVREWLKRESQGDNSSISYSESEGMVRK